MAYTPLNLADIQAGKPVKEEIFQTIRDNQESFNTDIEALKQTSVIDIYNMVFAGAISDYSISSFGTRVPIFRAPVAATIVGFKVVLLSASGAGNLQVQLDKSTDEGVNWNTLLTSPVTVSSSTVGSVSGAVNWVSVAAQSFNQNDLLRVRITGIKANQGTFHVHIYGEVS